MKNTTYAQQGEFGPTLLFFYYIYKKSGVKTLHVLEKTIRRLRYFVVITELL